ncbi:MAG: SDR family NAD(P)-dependent oxidoreductase [Bacteroidales bacterium]|nr:SDR family NAD(P)-dependent oxidoreductase [Bacteroidales bacterium]
MKTIITGATDGIGKQTALELAQLGHHVFIHGRNEERLSETKNWILNQVPNAEIQAFRADFASLKEVSTFAKQLLSLNTAFDVLINNAGVIEKKLAYSADGFERTFAINHLAPFYLTLLLLPHLKKQTSCKIINVASDAQATTIDFNALNAEKGFNIYDAYELSKLCNVLFTFKLAREVDQNQITVNALHPGVISTKILHAGWGMGGASWHSGAATSVYLASTSKENQGSGHYYVNKQKAKAVAAAYDKENQDLLWEKSLQMCQLKLS